MRGGQNSAALIQPLTDLGLLREEQGQLDAAAEAFQKARNVLGLKASRRSKKRCCSRIWCARRREEARGGADAAWTLEREMLAPVGEHPRDVRTVAMLRAVAEKRMNVLGCHYARISSIYSLLVRAAIERIFAPWVPVALPTFRAAPLVAAEAGRNLRGKAIH